MLITYLLTLLLGIIYGILLFALILLYLFKIKCPNCQQLRPLKEIIFLNLKQKTVSGQPCPRCQATKTKSQLEIF